METIFIRKIREIIQNKKNLEKFLRVQITLKDHFVSFEGNSLDEYEAALVFNAIGFGFSAAKALMLKNEEFSFRRVRIKEHSKRNLREIKSRVIGTKGKTRRTMSDISGCEIIIKESEIGILGYTEDVESVEQAIINVIKGSKQGNMYQYLQKMNQLKKKYADD